MEIELGRRCFTVDHPRRIDQIYNYPKCTPEYIYIYKPRRYAAYYQSSLIRAKPRNQSTLYKYQQHKLIHPYTCLYSGDARLSLCSRVYASNDRMNELWSRPVAVAMQALCSPSLCRAITICFLVRDLTAEWILLVIP